MDQTQTYCMALLNQEKSLEELQKHLHKTEVETTQTPNQRPSLTRRMICTQELFRESVKRKNQQLDLLQSEVRGAVGWIAHCDVCWLCASE